MIDIETRARRAGDAARTEAAALVDRLEVPGSSAPMRRERRVVGRPLAGALAGALAVLLVVLLVGQLDRPGVPTIDPAAPDLSEVVSEPVAVDGVLPVPPVGEVIAAYLDDGTPVFVSHPEAGEVYVLEAFDGHGPGGIHEMVHWCPTSGQFEEARHSTRFNAYGDYAGGPAPRALLDVPAELLGDGTVRVTGPPGPARARTDVRAEVPMRGPQCLDADGQLTQDAVLHELPAEVPELDGSSLPQERWMWAQVRLGGPEGDPRVCELDGRCPAGAPRIGSGWGLAAAFESELATVLARGEGPDAMLAVGPDPTRSRHPWVGYVTRSLPIPGAGRVVLDQLEDGTPVIVTHGADGELHVLEAAPRDRPHLVAACPSAGFLTDGSGAVWGLDGSAAETAGTDGLGAYPFAVVEAGEARAIRVTGPAGPPAPPSDGGPELAAGRCPGELETHRPSGDEAVLDRLSPLRHEGGVSDTRSWHWVEARVAELEGELVLCAYLGPDRCGEPIPTDDTTADCYADLPTGGACADRDPVVVTPGVFATLDPVLLLARLSADGGEVEVRFPAESDGT